MATHTRRILIIDDHAQMRAFMRSMLEGPNWEVTEGGDGEEAVRLFSAETPDLVLMDVEMPVMDGIEATREILRNCPGACVVVITQHDDPAIEKQAIAAGAQAFLPKTKLSQLPALLSELPPKNPTKP